MNRIQSDKFKEIIDVVVTSDKCYHSSTNIQSVISIENSATDPLTYSNSEDELEHIRDIDDQQDGIVRSNNISLTKRRKITHPTININSYSI